MTHPGVGALTALAFVANIAIEPLGLFHVLQATLAALARIRVHERNLLEARVVVTTYNQHVRLLSPEPSGGLAITRVYSEVGADIVRNH